MGYELADFHPGTGHLHACAKTRVSSGADCGEDCANWLFTVAQDIERQTKPVDAELFKAHMFDRMECHDHPEAKGCCPAGCHDLNVSQNQHYADLVNGGVRE